MNELILFIVVGLLGALIIIVCVLIMVVMSNKKAQQQSMAQSEVQQQNRMIEMNQQPVFDSPAGSACNIDERQTATYNRENELQLDGAKHMQRSRNYSEKARTSTKHVKRDSDKL